MRRCLVRSSSSFGPSSGAAGARFALASLVASVGAASVAAARSLASLVTAGTASTPPLAAVARSSASYASRTIAHAYGSIAPSPSLSSDIHDVLCCVASRSAAFATSAYALASSYAVSSPSSDPFSDSASEYTRRLLRIASWRPACSCMSPVRADAGSIGAISPSSSLSGVGETSVFPPASPPPSAVALSSPSAGVASAALTDTATPSTMSRFF